MKNLLKISGVLLLIILINSCKKEKPTPPVLTTTAIAEITYTTATSGGIVTNEGGNPVVSRGVCWNTSSNPTMTNSMTVDGSGLGAFISKITLLSPNTLYYVRAYAMNSAGTGYGNEVTFTTSKIEVPVLTTTAITSIASTTAVSGGNISTDNGGSVSARGVCWGTAANPTITNTKTTDGTGTGSFVSNLTGLQSGTIYYVRSYATNSAGTSYGNEISFTTIATPTLTTTVVNTITQITAASGGNISSDGGAAVTARGVCWNTAINPTIDNNKTTDGTGTGAFTSSIAGLTANTTYYLRAYATNSVGTAYGSQVSFTTLQTLATPSVSTTTVSVFTGTTATVGGNVTSDGNVTVSERGVYWSTTQNPETSGTKLQIGSGTGTFSSTLTGLTANTTYYIKAYAINSQGTGYGIQVNFTTQNSGGSATVTDIVGNVYNTVTIGTQVWMKENLKTTKYNDGSAIPNVTNDNAWNGLTTAAYAWYKNDSATYKNPYGAMYNWFAVNTGKLCPSGWHVPSDEEWHTLALAIDPNAVLSGGESNIAGGKMKETGTAHWGSPNAGATNESGFTAVAGGNREDNISGGYDSSTNFEALGLGGCWWTSTEYNANIAWYRSLSKDSGTLARLSGTNQSKRYGYSVRCVKD